VKQWSNAGGDLQYGRLVSGGDALVQRHEHMLHTVPGELGSDAEWGIGARALLGRDTASVDLRGLAATYRAQHLRDPETIEVEATIDYDGSRLDYAATIVAANGVASELEIVIE
jgi:hypothetical protein